MSGKSRAFTLVELLVVMTIIGILVSLLLPAVQQVREAARRVSCANNMRNQMLAIMNYESALRRYPHGASESGAVWSAFIAPFMEQNQLYAKMELQDADEDDVFYDGVRQWAVSADPTPDLNHPDPVVRNNAARRLGGEMYMCPSSESVGLHSGASINGDVPWQILRTSYVPCGFHEILQDDDFLLIDSPELVFTGAFVYGRQVQHKEFTDGLSHTIFIGETYFFGPPIPDRPVPEVNNACVLSPGCTISPVKDIAYLGSDDLDMLTDFSEGFHTTAIPPNKFREPVVACLPPDCRANPEYELFELNFGSHHPAVTQFSFGDGSVRVISDFVDRNIFRALGSRGGRESSHNLD